jgi:putative DNA methylase
LDAINKASAREKSIRHGHPSTLHLWWARRPLAAARAVIFAQMVDDPSAYVDVLLSDPKKKRAAERELKKRLAEHAAKKTLADDDAIAESEPTLAEVIAEIERDRLFAILEELVLWENTTNEAVLEKARAEIWQSWRRACADNADHPRAKELFDRNKLPGFHDPFAGGGALPLEAQRLGLEAYASDLNPVAVLINKAMIEIPPKFAGKPPVNPESRQDKNLFAGEWKGAQGIAEDVRYYGQWMRDEAEKRIGHLYPKIEVTAEIVKARPDLKPYAGRKLTVIAWLWARTVKSPNPAFSHVDVPLVASFLLGTKPGKEAYLEPIVEGDRYRFTVRVGKPKDTAAARAGTKLGRGANFRCLISGSPMTQEYIRGEFRTKRSGERLMAVVAEGDRSRVYLDPTTELEDLAKCNMPAWYPEQEMNQKTSNLVSGRGYGISHWHELFTPRQLTSLSVLSELVSEARCKAMRDALAARAQESNSETEDAARTYADALAVYLAFCIDRTANYCSKACTWHSGRKYETVTSTFGRQAIPMTWDFAESNPFSGASGNWLGGIEWLANAIGSLPGTSHGFALQADAGAQSQSFAKIVSTDPPYYDNIGYADLSDFFYVWLRHSLKPVYPRLFSTLAVPKAEELVATLYRHGTKEDAEAFFVEGMTQAMRKLSEQSHPVFPVTIYYAFKQAETETDEGTASTGWETFLDAVIQAGFAVSGTWPVRTEYTGNLKKNVAALASSIVLVCRKRADEAPTSTRRDFITALKSELPRALIHLQRGNIAPVDLAQAAIGRAWRSTRVMPKCSTLRVGRSACATRWL